MNSIWTQKLKQSEDVLHQELSGETVLLNLKTEHYFGLDPVGTRIWQLLGETSNAEDVVKTLLDEYEVEEAQLRADVERLLGELASAGLVMSETN
jgi:Coenzyme PQQ synthesis protein D (PqqD)